ncbi:MAG: hypothetical protein WCF18_16125 [Chthoniobacteraceae bacterium]
MKNAPSSIELLEPRIAPATLVGNVLTYTDIDGDLVKVAFTKATMDPGDFAFSTGTANDGVDTPRTLTGIDLSGNIGGGFILTATPKTGKGDSQANVGAIISDTDIGTVKVDGDVAAMGGFANPNVKSFTALSMGVVNPANGTSASYLGSVGTFAVKGSVVSVALNFSSSVKSLSIGGNFGAATSSTFANIGGTVGSFKVAGSIIGKDLSVVVHGAVGAFSVGGSIVGGKDDLPSGAYQVDLSSAKSISVGGDLRGGAGVGGGSIIVGGTVASVKIGGSMIGAGDKNRSASFIGANVGSFTIGHDLVSNLFGGTASENGTISLSGNLGSLKIGGDIIAGAVTSSGYFPATISAKGTIGSLSVGGSILGVAAHPIYILAGGFGAAPGATAIKSFTVKHNVEFARIVAGYEGIGTTFTQRNTDAGIGSISIGGNLTGTQIDIGSTPGSDEPGTSNDLLIPTSLARLDSIKIGGALTGIAGDPTTYYVQAPVIKKATIGKATYSGAQLQGYVDLNAIGKAAIGGLA